MSTVLAGRRASSTARIGSVDRLGKGTESPNTIETLGELASQTSGGMGLCMRPRSNGGCPKPEIGSHCIRFIRFIHRGLWMDGQCRMKTTAATAVIIVRSIRRDDGGRSNRVPSRQWVYRDRGSDRFIPNNGVDRSDRRGDRVALLMACRCEHGGGEAGLNARHVFFGSLVPPIFDSWPPLKRTSRRVCLQEANRTKPPS